GQLCWQSVVKMTFDWKDGWLIAFGFAALVLLQTVLQLMEIELSRGVIQGLAAAFILSPPAARRAIFGQPLLGRRRDGAIYRMASMLGLLALFFGMATGAVAANRMSLPKEERPDFLAEELRYVDDAQTKQ